MIPRLRSVLLPVAAMGLAVFAVAAIPTGASAAACQVCLETALQEQADANYNFIKSSWQNYRDATRMLGEIEAGGTAEQIAAARDLLGQQKAHWEVAERLAKAISEPSFATYLRQEQQDLEKRLAHAQARQRKEVDFDKRLAKAVYGPERRGLVADIQGYREEGLHLQQMAHEDFAMFGLNYLSESGGALLQWNQARLAGSLGKGEMSLALETTRAAETQRKELTTGLAMMLDGKALSRASDENNNAEVLARSVAIGGEGALRFTTLLADSPGRAEFMRETMGVAAEKAPLYLSVVALMLDTGLVCAAVNRMNAATAQLEAQELTEVAMRQRIAVATDYELRVKRRLNFQKSEIAYQKRIATLYGDIRRQAP